MQVSSDDKMGENSTGNSAAPIVVMIPMFNDWESLALLLKSVDRVLFRESLGAEVIVVDDGSYVPEGNSFNFDDGFKAIKKIGVLELRRNLGHQRAIAIGLAYIEAQVPCEAVVVMDADGEDNPKYIGRLIRKCKEEKYGKIIFAHRTRRSENRLFKVFYGMYTLLFRILTGNKMRVGNFSVIPHRLLGRLVGTSEIWNHYTAGVLKARINYAEIHTKRSNRLCGRSRMNFVSLVIHGLSAISVFGETVGARMAIALSPLIFLAAAAIVVIVCIKTFTNLAIPGWASTVVLLLAIFFMQAFAILLFFLLVVLNSRNNYNFLPNRDYRHLVLRFRQILSQE
jgi:glycosyltransferase involved in cell wall biosynthesis